jgi:hypothetical protein
LHFAPYLLLLRHGGLSLESGNLLFGIEAL